MVKVSVYNLDKTFPTVYTAVWFNRKVAADVIFHIVEPVSHSATDLTNQGVLDASRFQVGCLDLEKVAPYPLLVLQASIDHLVLDSDADIFVLSIYLSSFLNNFIWQSERCMIINAVTFDIIEFTIFSFILF